MEEYRSAASEIFSSPRYDESGSRDDQEDQKVYYESQGFHTEPRWWSRDSDEKPDPKQRWSFGSDLSIEADETVQNRLCCSPADEFDSTISSENDDLIVNCTDDVDTSYTSYSGIAVVNPASFKEVDDESSDDNDVDTADDELIDYSKRYTTDVSSGMGQNKQVTQTHPQKNESGVRAEGNRPVIRKGSANGGSKLGPYRDYAETDLDQPTDYSLRYAEERIDGEKKNNAHYLGTNDAEDYVRTYYTEGTPYQTPSNFSAATSISDLSSIDGVRGEPDEVHQSLLLKKEKSPKSVQQRFIRSIRDPSMSDCVFKPPKAITIPTTRDAKCIKVCEKNLKKPSNLPPPIDCGRDQEIRPVGFCQNENSAQETPLVFSRSSSLDSLSDFEQNLINDDGSSVISDFSHRTSGAVSPSELPDSPTQIILPSAAKFKQQNFEYYSQNPQKTANREPLQKPPVHLHIQINRFHASDESGTAMMLATKPASIFEDGLVSFEEESIPAKSHSTRASSLSALTIDDESDSNNELGDKEIMCRISAMKNKTAIASLYQADKSVQNYEQNLRKSDERAQCSRSSSSFTGSISNFPFVNKTNICSENSDGYGGTNELTMNKQAMQYSPRDPRDDPISDADKIKILSHYQSRNRTKRVPTAKSNSGPRIPPAQKVDSEDQIKICDSTQIYHTENTPTYISPCGSLSNLSALSILSGPEENFRSEQFRLAREQERIDSQDGSYCSDEEKLSSDVYEENEEDGAYEIEEESQHRIDVSPFDSQTNLANFSLLSIEEENEDEEEENDNADDNDEVKAEPIKKSLNYKTDDVARVHDERIYERFSQISLDYVDEQAVLEECIKTGASRFARQKFHSTSR
ncbi:hypothetical protein QAD02_012319 [Eretmocerus hayati]|uniref:Uncharacterized protein n=1 Tax=Eretmocerus hayati TaxID=131215 RepID=A0ACC2NZF4_9HYME|nr:hypothetical protein QAD02_012319 [Eretmocerus hayati]